MTEQVPPGLDPNNTQPRTFTIQADTRTLDGMLKEGETGQFTIQSDEGPRLGGNASAPSPMQYFMLGVGF